MNKRTAADWTIGQVAIAVADMQRSVAFYRDKVGLPFLFEAPNVAFFDCGDVRLMLGPSQDTTKKPYGTVIYFNVANIHAAFSVLKDRGVPVVSEPHLIARMADYDLWMAFFRDPDENMFALMAEIREGRDEPAGS